MCQKLGEEAAATALKQARKRERTEQGKTWDESIEKGHDSSKTIRR